jgi:hypothetical protein
MTIRMNNLEQLMLAEMEEFVKSHRHLSWSTTGQNTPHLTRHSQHNERRTSVHRNRRLPAAGEEHILLERLAVAHHFDLDRVAGLLVA